MISPFIRAHGYIPGPTERPAATGLLTGVLASFPALLVAWAGGALPAAAQHLGIDPATATVLFGVLLAAAGTVYGQIFRRAANDRRGGWLFGISYGFIAWMLGPATVLQWMLGRPIALGVAAQFVLGAHLVYGLLLGILFPHIGGIVRRNR